ncbi:hypothetical protein FHS68_002709 [Dyadobacter arcticus]|uniref:Uncharacterized protein n=1 Tax=Dyadobacter arcticus TaxID=1078754 RepID=A0ABX0UKL3_9BACT|nr:hypothetical protein [Dyadobacter arcticus]
MPQSYSIVCIVRKGKLLNANPRCGNSILMLINPKQKERLLAAPWIYNYFRILNFNVTYILKYQITFGI